MPPHRPVRRQASSTLPLFGNGVVPVYRPRPGGATSKAASQALSIYWSAVLHAHALGAAVPAAEYPSERQALEALLAAELERKERARRLLREVWGVKFLGSAPPGAPQAA